MYFRELLPAFEAIKTRGDEILVLNQDNMTAMDRRAPAERRDFGPAHDRSPDRRDCPLGRGIAPSQPVDPPVDPGGHGGREPWLVADSIRSCPPRPAMSSASSADAFNDMARTLREYRQAGSARLLRAQKTAQATIDSFPDPVVVVDPMGSVEQANPAARRLLSVVAAAETPVPWYPAAPLKSLVDKVLSGQGDYLPVSLEQAIALADGGQERFFLPRVLAIRAEHKELLGAAVALVDVTKFHLLDQLKSDMVSTVDHELKTPLTSVQMAIHLLLEEVVGPLTPKQVELLLAARRMLTASSR